MSIEVEKNLSEADFVLLRGIIHRETGITIAENRRSMLVSRLQRRLSESGEGTFRKYIKRITNDPQEMQELTNRITTNETYFYRTPRVWSHLREEAIPDFLAKNSARTMKIWSAAASTGEEGHTLGIVLEDIRKKHPGFDYSILGTDISSRVIAVADKGRYVGRPVARFRKEEPELFKNYMIGDDEDGFRVTPDIKKRIKFKLHNLVNPLESDGPFDVVFLRNVLIYFSAEDQEKILANVYDKMKPQGMLAIGESETLHNLNTNFEPVAPLIYRAMTCGRGRPA